MANKKDLIVKVGLTGTDKIVKDLVSSLQQSGKDGGAAFEKEVDKSLNNVVAVGGKEIKKKLQSYLTEAVRSINSNEISSKDLTQTLIDVIDQIQSPGQSADSINKLLQSSYKRLKTTRKITEGKTDSEVNSSDSLNKLIDTLNSKQLNGANLTNSIVSVLSQKTNPNVTEAQFKAELEAALDQALTLKSAAGDRSSAYKGFTIPQLSNIYNAQKLLEEKRNQRASQLEEVEAFIIGKGSKDKDYVDERRRKVDISDSEISFIRETLGGKGSKNSKEHGAELARLLKAYTSDVSKLPTEKDIDGTSRLSTLEKYMDNLGKTRSIASEINKIESEISKTDEGKEQISKLNEALGYDSGYVSNLFSQAGKKYTSISREKIDKSIQTAQKNINDLIDTYSESLVSNVSGKNQKRRNKNNSVSGTTGDGSASGNNSGNGGNNSGNGENNSGNGGNNNSNPSDDLKNKTKDIEKYTKSVKECYDQIDRLYNKTQDEDATPTQQFKAGEEMYKYYAGFKALGGNDADLYDGIQKTIKEYYKRKEVPLYDEDGGMDFREISDKSKEIISKIESAGLDPNAKYNDITDLSTLKAQIEKYSSYLKGSGVPDRENLQSFADLAGYMEKYKSLGGSIEDFDKQIQRQYNGALNTSNKEYSQKIQTAVNSVKNNDSQENPQSNPSKNNEGSVSDEKLKQAEEAKKQAEEAKKQAEEALKNAEEKAAKAEAAQKQAEEQTEKAKEAKAKAEAQAKEAQTKLKEAQAAAEKNNSDTNEPKATIKTPSKTKTTEKGTVGTNQSDDTKSGSDTTNNNSDLEKQLKDAEETRKKAETSQKTAETKAKNASDKLKEAQAKVKEVEDAKKQIEAKIAELEAQIKANEDSQKTDNKETKTSKKTTKSSKKEDDKTKNTSTSDLEKQLAEARAAQQQAEETQKQAEEARKQAEAKAQKAEESRAKAENKVAEIQKQIEKTKANETDKQTQEAQKKAQTAQKTAETKAKNASDKLKEAQAKAKEAENAQKEAEKRVAELEAQIKASENAQSSDGKTKTSEGTSKSSKGNNNKSDSKLNSDLKKQLAEAQAAQKQAEEAQKQADEAQKQAEEKASKAETSKVNADKKVAQAKKLVQEMQKQLKEAEKQAEEAKANESNNEAQEAQKQAEAAQKKAETARKKAEEAKKQAQEAQKQAEEAQKQAEDRAKKAQESSESYRIWAYEAEDRLDDAEKNLEQERNKSLEMEKRINEAEKLQADTVAKAKQAQAEAEAKVQAEKEARLQAELTANKEHAYSEINGFKLSSFDKNSVSKISDLNKEDSYTVKKFYSKTNETSDYGNLLGSDIKKMLKGYSFDEDKQMWFSKGGNVAYTISSLKEAAEATETLSDANKNLSKDAQQASESLNNEQKAVQNIGDSGNSESLKKQSSALQDINEKASQGAKEVVSAEEQKQEAIQKTSQIAKDAKTAASTPLAVDNEVLGSQNGVDTSDTETASSGILAGAIESVTKAKKDLTEANLALNDSSVKNLQSFNEESMAADDLRRSIATTAQANEDFLVSNKNLDESVQNVSKSLKSEKGIVTSLTKANIGQAIKDQVASLKEAEEKAQTSAEQVKKAEEQKQQAIKKTKKETSDSTEKNTQSTEAPRNFAIYEAQIKDLIKSGKTNVINGITHGEGSEQLSGFESVFNESIEKLSQRGASNSLINSLKKKYEKAINDIMVESLRTSSISINGAFHGDYYGLVNKSDFAQEKHNEFSKLQESLASGEISLSQYLTQVENIIDTIKAKVTEINAPIQETTKSINSDLSSLRMVMDSVSKNDSVLDDFAKIDELSKNIKLSLEELKTSGFNSDVVSQLESSYRAIFSTGRIDVKGSIFEEFDKLKAQLSKKLNISQIQQFDDSFRNIERQLSTGKISFVEYKQAIDGLFESMGKVSQVNKTSQQMSDSFALKLSKIKAEISSFENIDLSTKVNKYSVKLQELQDAYRELERLMQEASEKGEKTYNSDGIAEQTKKIKDLEKVLSSPAFNKINSSGKYAGEMFETKEAVINLDQLTNAAKEYAETMKLTQKTEFKATGANEIVASFKDADGVLKDIIFRLNDVNTESITVFTKSGSSMATGFKALAQGIGRYIQLTFDLNQIIMTVTSKFREGITVLKDYDTSLTTISYTTDFTKSQLKDLGQSAIDVANDMDTSIENAMKVYEIYSNKNISANQIKELAAPTLILSNLSGVDSSTAADEIQAVINQFDMAAEAGSHVVDVYDRISSEIGVDYSKGISGMAAAVENSGQAAKVAGLSFEQLSAIVAKTMEKTRQDGGQIGNSLKTIMTRLSKVSNYSDDVDPSQLSTVAKDLHDIGIEVYTDTGEYREFDTIMSEIAAQWDNLTDAQQAQLSFDIAATRQTSIFKSILESWTDSMNLATEATNANGNAMANEEKRAESYTGKLQSISTQVDTFTMSLLNSDGFKVILTGIDDLLSGINGISKATSPLLVVFGALAGIVPLLGSIYIFQGKINKARMEGNLNSLADFAEYSPFVEKILKLKTEVKGAFEAFGKGFIDAFKGGNEQMSLTTKLLNGLKGGFTGLTSTTAGVGVAITGAITAAVIAYNIYESKRQEAITNAQKDLDNANERIQNYNGDEYLKVLEYDGKGESQGFINAVNELNDVLGENAIKFDAASDSAQDYINKLKNQAVIDTINAAEDAKRVLEKSSWNLGLSQIDTDLFSPYGNFSGRKENNKKALDIVRNAVGEENLSVGERGYYLTPKSNDAKDILNYFYKVKEARDALAQSGETDNVEYDNLSKTYSDLATNAEQYAQALYQQIKAEYIQQNGIPTTINAYNGLKKAIQAETLATGDYYDELMNYASIDFGDLQTKADQAAADANRSLHDKKQSVENNFLFSGTKQIKDKFKEDYEYYRHVVDDAKNFTENASEITIGKISKDAYKLGMSIEDFKKSGDLKNWYEGHKYDIDSLFNIGNTSKNSDTWDAEEWQRQLDYYKKYNKSMSEVAASIGSVLNGSSSDSSDGLKAKIDAYETELSSLQGAITKLNTGAMGDSDLIALVEQFPNLAPYINDTDALKTEIQSLIDTSEKGIDKQIDEEIKKLKNDSPQAAKALELLKAKIDVLNDMHFNITDETTNFTNLATALKESASATGLTESSMKSLEAMYSNLQGYDPSRLFEETTEGIHLNRKAVQDLQEQYEKSRKSAIADELENLQKEYKETADAIATCTNEQEKLKWQSDLDSISKQIEQVEILQAQYDGLTSKFNKWQQAISGGNERDNYESVGKSYADMQKLIKQGWAGDESLNSWLDLILNANERTGNAYADFKKLDTVISGTTHKIKDYWRYSKDGDLVQTGLFNFLDDVHKVFGDEYVKKAMDGSYSFNFTGKDSNGAEKMDTIAEKFGITTELIQLMEKALVDTGAVVDLGQSKIDESNSKMDSFDSTVQKVNSDLKELQSRGIINDSIDLDFDPANMSLDQIKKKIDELKKEKIKIDSEVKTDNIKLASSALEKDIEELTHKKVLMSINAKISGKDDELKKLEDMTSKPAELKAALNLDTDEETKEAINWLNEKVVTASIDVALKKDNTVDSLLQMYEDDKKNGTTTFQTTLKIDSSQVDSAKTKLDEMKESLQDQESTIKFDSDQFNELKSALSGDVDVTATADLNSAAQARQDIQDEVNSEPVTVSVKAENGEASDKVDEVKNKAAESNPVEKVDANTKPAFDQINAFKNTIDSLRPEINVEVNKNTLVDSLNNALSGNHTINLTPNIGGVQSSTKRQASPVYSGVGFANGTDGAPAGRALVGELGQELVVDPNSGTWHTVGDSGAEFIDMPKNAIVFNHRQTQNLLKSGSISSRGTALANGNVTKADYSKYAYLNSLSKEELLQCLEDCIYDAEHAQVGNGTANFLRHLENPIFGNIDVSNRQVLNWDKDSIDKYTKLGWNRDFLPNVGDYSTILGASGIYTAPNGVDYNISYSTMLQQKNGEPLLLPDDIIGNYFMSLFDEMGDNFSQSEFLRLDHKGLETTDNGLYGDLYLHDLVAGIAPLSDKVRSHYQDLISEEMHYVGQYWDTKNVIDLKSHAAGGGIPTDEHNALVGELGQELVVTPNGDYYTVGDNGAEFVDLKKGSKVFNAKDTKKILGRAHAHGTAHFGGNNEGVGAVKAPDISVGSAGYQKATKDNTNATKKNTDAVNKSTQKFDWISRAIKSVTDVVNRISNKITDFITTGSKNNYIDKEISVIQRQITTEEKAAAAYMKAANAINLSDEYKNKIINGDFSVEEIDTTTNKNGNNPNKDLVEAINNYQEYYDKAIECSDAVQELINKVKELSKQRFDNLNDSYKNAIGLIDHDSNMIQGQINALDGSNPGISGGYYDSLVQNQKNKVAMYNQAADALSAQLAEMVNSGEIEEYSAAWYDMVNAINEVQEAAMEAENAIKDLLKQKFDELAKSYENAISLIDHDTNMLEKKMDIIENMGMFVSKNYYQALIKTQQDKVATLKEEYGALQDEFNSIMETGEIKEYSNTWYEMVNTMNSVEESILDAENAMIKYKNAMREMDWKVFDKQQEYINAITDEANFVVDMLSSEKLYEDDGTANDRGVAAKGLHAMNYDVYMAEAQNYAEKVKEIEKDLAEEPLNTKLVDQKMTYIKAQQDAIQNAQKEKEAVKSLISDGYSKMIDSLKDIIDLKKEILQADKDERSYQKNVKDQTKKINSYEKQLMAYQNDDSEETKAKLQQIKTNLEDAKSDLEDIEYDQWIDDQNSIMSKIADEFQENIDTRLDNIDDLFSQVIDFTNTNADTIKQTIEQVTSDVGYTISDSLSNIWNSDGGLNQIVSNFGSDFGSVATTTQGYVNDCSNYLQRILDTVSKGFGSFDSFYSSVWNGTSGSYASGSSSKKNTGSGNTSASSDIKAGSTINAGKATIYATSNGTGGGTQYYASDPIYTVLSEQNGYYLVRYHNLSSGYTGWFKKSDVKAYAKGTNNAHGGISLTDEYGLGTEAIITKQGVLRQLQAGDTVFSQAQVQRLWEMSKMDNAKYANAINSVSNNVSNDVNVNISLPGVTKYDEFVRQLQRDPKFEQIVQQMTIGSLAGSNSLSKMKIRV